MSLPEQPPAPPADPAVAPAPPPFEAPPSFEAPLAPLPVVVPPRPRASLIFLAVVSIVSLALDLGSKHWATVALQRGDSPAPKTIIKGVFGFMLAKNKGGAWGLLSEQPEKVRVPFFVVVSVLAIVFIVSLYRRLHPSQKALKWGLPLVLGGALGNLADRIRFGSVVDFIDIQATWENFPHHWPTFNVADIAICVGVLLMAVDMLSGRKLPKPDVPVEAPPPPPVVGPPPEGQPSPPTV